MFNLKHKVQEALIRLTPRLTTLAGESTYIVLAAATFLPLALAMQANDSTAFMVFGQIAASLGTNLVAGQIQRTHEENEAQEEQTAQVQERMMVWKNADDAKHDIEQWSNDEQFRAMIDAALQRADTIAAARAGLADADRTWFTETLREEMQALGNLQRFEAVLTGNGAIAQGTGAKAVGAGGVMIEGNNSGNINTGVQNIYQNGEDPAENQELIQHYLRTLLADCTRLKLDAIDQAAVRPDRSPLELADVYVDLNTTLSVPDDCDTLATYFARERAAKEKLPQSADREKQPRVVSALEAMGHHRDLVLLGKPGSGKSTFVSYLVLQLAQALLGNKQTLSLLGASWRDGALLPVRVVLRQFAAELPAKKKAGRAGDLWDFIGRELVHSGLGEKTLGLIRRIARKDGALFLFDGLDECGDASRQKQVLEAVADFKKSTGANCRFLTTARPYAWPNGAAPQAGVYMLADLNRDQIKAFIKKWFVAILKRGWLSEREIGEKRQGLLVAAKRNDLLPLAQNPLLLTLMATLHTSRGRLPDDRVDLYDEVVKLLMQRWNEPIGADKALLSALGVPGLTLEVLRGVIEKLAFDVHGDNIGVEGTADITDERLRTAFVRTLQGSWDKAGIVVDYIERRAGLLIGLGLRNDSPHFTFPHRTFQEYLAACHLANQADFPARVCTLAEANPDHWREVLALAARQAKVERGSAAADALIHGRDVGAMLKRRELTEQDWQRAILAAEQLIELGPAVAGSDAASAAQERVVGWLVALIESTHLSPRERARAGRALSQLGDTLKGVGLRPDGVPDIGWVIIPRDGEFIYGEGKTLCKLHLPAYKISRYPITYAQFQAFMDADDGYRNPIWWEGLAAGEEHRNAPGDQAFKYANHPRDDVSWYDAVAFCRWLSNRINEEVSLPTEQQWEKTARGRDGRAYPWGPEYIAGYANIDETEDKVGPNYLQTTSTVGIYAQSASPYKVMDMSGNVWEWCLNEYKKPSNVQLAGNEVRVLRGGSWDDNRDLARCSYRDRTLPDLRVNYLGFRVVVRLAPVS